MRRTASADALGVHHEHLDTLEANAPPLKSRRATPSCMTLEPLDALERLGHPREGIRRQHLLGRKGHPARSRQVR